VSVRGVFLMSACTSCMSCLTYSNPVFARRYFAGPGVSACDNSICHIICVCT